MTTTNVNTGEDTGAQMVIIDRLARIETKLDVYHAETVDHEKHLRALEAVDISDHETRIKALEGLSQTPLRAYALPVTMIGAVISMVVAIWSNVIN